MLTCIDGAGSRLRRLLLPAAFRDPWAALSVPHAAKGVPDTTLLPVCTTVPSYSLLPAQDSWLPVPPAEASVIFFFKKYFSWCAAALGSPAAG